VHFVQPAAPPAEVEEQFSDLIFRFRALPALSRELAEGADQLSDLSEAEFERFAQLQRQVASAVSRDVAEDSGDQAFSDRFAKKIAEVMREKGAWKPGRRPEKYR
jgi:DNA primase